MINRLVLWALVVLSLGSLQAKAPGDYDGDGKTDFAVFRPANGTWYVQGSKQGALPSQQWGLNGDIPVPGDYDGDGVTDYAVFRPGNGTWYIQASTQGVLSSQQWGQSGDIPVPGDYNGDGKTDLAVFRPSNGVWYINGIGTAQLGQNGDIPVPGDYNGDGLTDYAVFRPANGTWYLQESNGPSIQVQFGTVGDIPVPGDYDGDRVTDIALFRPSTGMWYAQTNKQGLVMVQWGQNGDIPVPGDYNGDGLTDYAVFRPGEGNWYPRLNGGTPVQCGQNGDLPASWYLPSISGTMNASGPGSPFPGLSLVTIQGHVTQNGSALSGVTVLLSGSAAASVNTDGSGNYGFTIPSGGSFTLTPTLTNYSFNPVNLSLSNVNTNQAGQNFSGSPTMLASVSAQGLTSLVVTTDHVYYVNDHQHICQSYFTGTGWVTQDLTALIGTSTLAAPGSALTSVLVTGGDHVYYLDASGHVNQLYSTGSAWFNQDLTAAAPSAPAVTGSALASILYNNADHVFYLDSQQHVNQLWWNGQQWVNQDLFQISSNAKPCPATTAAAHSGLNSVAESNGYVEVYYTDANQHIGHLSWNTQSWQTEDLTCLTNAASVKPGSALSGYSSAVNGTAHLFYFDGQPHVDHIWRDTTWHPEDLTAKSQANATPAAASGLTSFEGPNGSAFVYYVDTQQHLNQMSWNGQRWANLDLTANTTVGLSAYANPNTALTSLFITGSNHVYYVGTDSQVHQVYWNGQTWANQDLSILGSGSVISGPSTAPTREYIYLNGKIIAIESSSH